MKCTLITSLKGSNKNKKKKV